MPFALDDQLIFPHPSLADEDGLLAIGGDLSSQRLLLAYEHAIFPWFSEDTPILWYAPHERFVLKPAQMKVSKSMRQFMRNTKLSVRKNTNFAAVIQHCATVTRSGQDGTWITADMQKAYIQLHNQGIAHSIETYDENNKLVGGLYGVKIGRVFCGESMFAKQSNASKLAFIYLCQQQSIDIIDCQVYTEHLASLGAGFISGETYYEILQQQKPNDHAL
ncbi:leucyl/phenylalanyl-tRNA--protein transferase [Sphingobacterium psychroaquaticum]|uniref:Leucyl/phenylalanyl-tRNA--protein transferase n=1 Tax=Sphingobacterium psychroaquaticum TaxID=561061 RepID=A0A1X7K305_9SPHI|nr:leucyl/phenylalanyl-tRNA--protein transferase [Sphingobacterium psychroaquaticum]SMG34550.1 leucyl/phenylalanyl-tRNA--protein transferase [Sphingobacterium psychroaquaticum]